MKGPALSSAQGFDDKDSLILQVSECVFFSSFFESLRA